jgi:nucleoside-diphosphate-sugar epimerase
LTRDGNNEFFRSNSIDIISANLDGPLIVDQIKKARVSGIVHLATHFVAEHRSEDINQLLDANIKFGCQLLEMAKTLDISWFLNTGTFWQHYDGDQYNPVNLYAATKQAFEDIARYYAITHELRFCTLKLCDTYGPGDTRKKIFNLWESVAKTGEVLEMSPGDQLIDIVHVDTVVEAFLKLIKMLESEACRKKNMETYYVSSGEEITLRDLANRYQETHNVTLNIKWGAKPYRRREVMKPQCIGERVIVDKSNN